MHTYLKAALMGAAVVLLTTGAMAARTTFRKRKNNKTTTTSTERTLPTVRETIKLSAIVTEPTADEHELYCRYEKILLAIEDVPPELTCVERENVVIQFSEMPEHVTLSDVLLRPELHLPLAVFEDRHTLFVLEQQVDEEVTKPILVLKFEGDYFAMGMSDDNGSFMTSCPLNRDNDPLRNLAPHGYVVELLDGLLLK